MKFLAFVSVMLGLFGTVSAATLKYAGVVTELTGEAGNSTLYGLVEEGDIVTGYFSYDPDGAVDTNAWDVVGHYDFNDSNSSLTVTIVDVSNENAILYEYSGHLSYILTENDWTYTPNPSLYPVIDAFTPVGLLDTGSEVFLRYQNRDTNLDLITSDALPEMPLAFEDYNHTTGSLTIPSTIGQVDLQLTELAPVPLPPTFMLLMSGVVLLVVGSQFYPTKPPGGRPLRLYS